MNEDEDHPQRSAAIRITDSDNITIKDGVFAGNGDAIHAFGVDKLTLDGIRYKGAGSLLVGKFLRDAVVENWSVELPSGLSQALSEDIKANNKQGFLEKIGKYLDPEKLAAAAVLYDRIRAGLGY